MFGRLLMWQGPQKCHGAICPGAPGLSISPGRTARDGPQTGWYPQFRSENSIDWLGKSSAETKWSLGFNPRNSLQPTQWKITLEDESPLGKIKIKKRGFLSHELVKTSVLKLVWLVVSTPEKSWSLVHPNRGVLRCYWNDPMYRTYSS